MQNCISVPRNSLDEFRCLSQVDKKFLIGLSLGVLFVFSFVRFQFRFLSFFSHLDPLETSSFEYLTRYAIDQHAADERVRVEHFQKQLFGRVCCIFFFIFSLYRFRVHHLSDTGFLFLD